MCYLGVCCASNLDSPQWARRKKNPTQFAVLRIFMLFVSVACQVRVSTTFGGLSVLHQEPATKCYADWRSWYHSSRASDQGGDELSQSHALQYLEEIKCNITPYYDPEHGINRDIWLQRAILFFKIRNMYKRYEDINKTHLYKYKKLSMQK